MHILISIIVLSWFFQWILLPVAIVIGIAYALLDRFYHRIGTRYLPLMISGKKW